MPVYVATDSDTIFSDVKEYLKSEPDIWFTPDASGRGVVILNHIGSEMRDKLEDLGGSFVNAGSKNW